MFDCAILLKVNFYYYNLYFITFTIIIVESLLKINQHFFFQCLNVNILKRMDIYFQIENFNVK